MSVRLPTSSPLHPALSQRVTGRAILALLLGVLGGGCSAEVGDSCSTNLECSPNGSRICDTAQPDGYCTVQGCGPSTCPEEATCVGFFPATFLSVACDPKTEDAVDPSIEQTNDCTGDEVCLQGGTCALFSLERRFCMKTCEDNSDCRAGYECRRAGTAGAEAVLDREATGGDTDVRRFCAQRL